MTRREFIKVLSAQLCAVAGGCCWTTSVLAETTVPPSITSAAALNGKSGSVFDQAEEQTRHILAQMQVSLQKQLADNPQSFSESLRMHLINVAMWPPVAPLAQDILTSLGDSAEARERFAFIMPMVKWMSEPFLFPVETGGTPEEKAREADKIFNLMAKLRKQGFATSLDNVGDASLSPKDALVYEDYYVTLIRAFIKSGNNDELYLSIKLSALVHDLDKALEDGPAAKAKRQEIMDALGRLLAPAAQAPDKAIFLRLDMEEYCYKNLTLQLFREIVENAPSLAIGPKGNLRIGVVIQAYLRSSAEDIRGLVNWARSRNLRVPIRLVKGAYLDYERKTAAEKRYPSPVWDNKPSTDANYEALSACMLLNLDTVLPAFATHNIRTQAHAIALTKAYGLPDEVSRIQMLYGMGDPIKHVVAAMGYPLREYIPAGSLARGLKYSGRRFEELASSDNALARTMRGDFREADGSTPIFIGESDIKDSHEVEAFLKDSLISAS
ncbi:MAG: proline dehydrogenase family protein [Pseudodesulfovibrio sp.]